MTRLSFGHVVMTVLDHPGYLTFMFTEVVVVYNVLVCVVTHKRYFHIPDSNTEDSSNI